MIYQSKRLLCCYTREYRAEGAFYEVDHYHEALATLEEFDRLFPRAKKKTHVEEDHVRHHRTITLQADKKITMVVRLRTEESVQGQSDTIHDRNFIYFLHLRVRGIIQSTAGLHELLDNVGLTYDRALRFVLKILKGLYRARTVRRRMAVSMALHKRLGSKADIAVLSAEVLARICQMI